MSCAICNAAQLQDGEGDDKSPLCAVGHAPDDATGGSDLKQSFRKTRAGSISSPMHAATSLENVGTTRAGFERIGYCRCWTGLGGQATKVTNDAPGLLRPMRPCAGYVLGVEPTNGA